ncbi:MAG TPA: 2-dehydropantoate 2-reductase [Vicinamibacterales bacterium]|nr:2-dehydropantoate 2-reductase [Vicinamibacterales bacterium]
MRIAVVGAGAIGRFFGAQLARSGEEVTFVARGETLRALQADGLRLDTPEGAFDVGPVRATDDAASVGPVDAIILGVKAWQVPEAARAARPMVGPGTVVLPLQNGVEAADQAAAEVGRDHVLGGLCHVIAVAAGPAGVRVQAGLQPTVTFAELDNRPSGRVDRLREVLGRAGVKAIVPADIQAALWSKFLFIAAFGGVGAVTRAPIGVVRQMPGTRQMLVQAMEEIAAVARARGVALDPEAVTAAMARLDGLAPASTPSMQRDIMDGRPSELDSQNGAVVRLGGQAGVHTPLHRFLYHALQPSERRARGEIAF